MSAPGKSSRDRGPLLGFREGKRAAVRMRELRAGLTQGQLAAKLGRSQSWVAKREQGGVRLSAAEAEMIADALGVPPAALTGEAP